MKKYLLLTIVLCLTLFVGCEKDVTGLSELRIQAIVPVSAPFGDVLTNDGTIPSDTIDIQFYNVYKDPSNFRASNYADIYIEKVTVSFNRVDGGSDTPVNFDQAITLICETDSTAVIEDFPIFPATRKLEFPVSDLVYYGYERSTNFQSIQVRVTLEVTGRTLAGDPVYAKGQIDMEFANWAG